MSGVMEGWGGKAVERDMCPKNDGPDFVGSPLKITIHVKVECDKMYQNRCIAQICVNNACLTASN